MLARATAATPWGIDARPVHVEVDVRNGLPQMQIVGLPDTAVRESRERVRAAIKNCGFELPPRAVVVNLAPADIRKVGNQLDLAIALAYLTALGVLPPEALERRIVCGELGLDGAVRPIRGGLAIADLGRRLGIRELLLPDANAGEAASLGSIAPRGTIAGPGVLAVIPLASLGEAVEHLVGARTLAPVAPRPAAEPGPEGAPDLAEVRGQDAAKRALEIAAAGGHNLLFIGPPGCGKTMLARRLPGLLPPLSLGEAIEVTKIRSLVADEPPAGLVRERPFRSPHHTVSTAGMVGGGSLPRPGEASLAHCGVLFLDELPEFQRSTLEALRQPLEEGRVVVVRARARQRFPARFALLAAMNPCPCGHLGDPRHECDCPPGAVLRYRSRISGPLLDRIDLHVEVPALSLAELKGPPGEPTAAVARRVRAARERQGRRLAGDLILPVNGAITDALSRRHCPLEPPAQKLIDAAFERLGLSARALTRILKVARTVADLAGSERIRAPHAAEAIQYRALDRRAPG